MIALTKTQILEIVREQLSMQLGQTPTTIKTNINWLRYDKYVLEWTYRRS